MIRKIIFTAALVALASCSNGPVEPPAPPALPQEKPAPTVTAGYWKPGPVTKFQVMHIKSFSDLQKKFRKGTQILNLELDQIEEAGGKKVADWVHAQGAKLVAYISTGLEDWRSDSSEYPKDAIGGKICKNKSCTSSWSGERWGKPLSSSFFAFQAKRITRASVAGVDGIDWDNTDWAFNNVGYSITEKQNLDAIKTIADMTHKQGLAFFAKNTTALSKELALFSDGVFIESCAEFNECSAYKPYLGKPIMMLEYDRSCAPFPGAACNKTRDYFE